MVQQQEVSNLAVVCYVQRAHLALPDCSSFTAGLCFCEHELVAPRSSQFLTPLCVSLITSSTNGYDGSMMNGLQSLDNWKNYFHNPRGSMLGLLNAIQVKFAACCASWS